MPKLQPTEVIGFHQVAHLRIYDSAYRYIDIATDSSEAEEARGFDHKIIKMERHALFQGVDGGRLNLDWTD